MNGTWRELVEKSVYLVQWPGWSGFIRLQRLKKGNITYESFDARGRRLPVGQQDYAQFADRKEWQEVDLTAVLRG